MEALRARIQSSGLSCAEQAALAPLNPNHIKVKVYDRAKYILAKPVLNRLEVSAYEFIHKLF